MKRAFLIFISLLLLFGCGAVQTEAQGPEWSSLSVVSELSVDYATQFRVETYTEGYTLLTVETSGRFLLVPEGAGVPKNLDTDITVLKAPLSHIYLAATSAMDFFRALDAIDTVRLSGTDENGWYIDEAKAAMQRGDMLFAGKYNAPDYERIFSEHCDLAIESTMIYHSPEIKEQLEKLGVPVLVERSSYEEDPLGRMEWIKFYGALLGKSEEAQAIFAREAAAVEPLFNQPETGKTVAFFYITTTGTVNVRKTNDYVPRMIALAGGTYIFQNLDSGSALSTVNMTMESFYDAAKDADVLIYNSTIDSELDSIDDLLKKSPLLKDFRAVQSGSVWCTGKNLFQEPMGLGKLITDFHRVLTEEDVPDRLNYLHRLNGGA